MKQSRVATDHCNLVDAFVDNSVWFLLKQMLQTILGIHLERNRTRQH